MKKGIFLPFFLIFVFSCKIQPGSDRNSAGENKIYKLRLAPPSGSKYHFEITNESKLNLEVNANKIENIKKMDVAINYEIFKDSSDNYKIGMTYDKIHLYTKTGEAISEMDAINAATSIDPVERMLGALKSANIVATVSSAGEVKSVSGYQEIANQILSRVDASVTDKAKAQMQWKQMVEQRLVKKNMDQLFKIFPDSAVHIGDKWKLFAHENEEIGFVVKNFYTLKAINDGVANIESVGQIESDSLASSVMGYEVSSDLKGESDGIYGMDIKTGMLVNCVITTKMEGTLQMAGRDIPIKMETKIKIEGLKLK